MKKIILFLAVFAFLFVGMSLTTTAQVKQAPAYRAPQEIVFRDLGTYNYKFQDGSSIGLHGYITKAYNTTGLYTQYRYVYTIYGESKSVYAGYYRATWLYNTRVYLNGSEVSAGQYPEGFTMYVRTTPTIIYYWYTNDEDVPGYSFNWANSAYDTN